jgi:TATA-box binding protein (TBP) (component of TFIID and TFIIIB)
MTGCKSIDDCISVLHTLCYEFKRVKAIVDPDTMNKIILKPFVSNMELSTIENVENIKIRMINSNFNIGFLVNRQQLYKILLKEKIDCTFEPCVHACVNVKYNYKDSKIISIFVFESGAIIITGAENRDHIMRAYEYITKKLYDNYNKISKKNMEYLLQKIDITKLISEVEAEANDKIINETKMKTDHLSLSTIYRPDQN